MLIATGHRKYASCSFMLAPSEKTQPHTGSGPKRPELAPKKEWIIITGLLVSEPQDDHKGRQAAISTNQNYGIVRTSTVPDNGKNPETAEGPRKGNSRGLFKE